MVGPSVRLPKILTHHSQEKTGVEEVTQARHLAEVEDMARGVVAVTRQVPEHSVNVTVEVPDAAEARTAWVKAGEDGESAHREVEAAAARGRAATTNTKARESFGVNDAAFVLGVSKQRLSQLTAK
jgi:hypothetical protein